MVLIIIYYKKTILVFEIDVYNSKLFELIPLKIKINLKLIYSKRKPLNIKIGFY